MDEEQELQSRIHALQGKIFSIPLRTTLRKTNQDVSQLRHRTDLLYVLTILNTEPHRIIYPEVVAEVVDTDIQRVLVEVFLSLATERHEA